MTIIVNLKNFTFAHDIVVMDNNNIVNATKASMKNIPELVCELAKTNNCEKVILVGSKFAKGIEEKIKTTFTAKYNTNCDFKIECV